jgi:hypothetical protein
MKRYMIVYHENTSIISLPQRGRAGVGAKKSKSLIPIFMSGGVALHRCHERLLKTWNTFWFEISSIEKLARKIKKSRVFPDFYKKVDLNL